MEKLKVNQDVLYQFITEHNVNLSGLAREMGVNPTLVAGCFRHNADRNGKPRHFTAATTPKLNMALGQMADKIRNCVITFGSEETFTNNRGMTYDPGTLPALRQLSQWFNLTTFIMRVLGWNEKKKNSVFSDQMSKSFGCISQDDVNRINAELLSVAGVLSSYEVVADEGSSSRDGDNAKPLKASAKRKTMESSYEAPKYEWDDTSIGLPERSALLRQRWPNGILLFRVNGGYTAEGDDARTVYDLLPDVQPYTDPASGMTTAYMSEEQMTQVLSQFIAQGRRVMITDMYKE